LLLTGSLPIYFTRFTPRHILGSTSHTVAVAGCSSRINTPRGYIYALCTRLRITLRTRSRCTFYICRAHVSAHTHTVLRTHTHTSHTCRRWWISSLRCVLRFPSPYLPDVGSFTLPPRRTHTRPTFTAVATHLIGSGCLPLPAAYATHIPVYAHYPTPAILPRCIFILPSCRYRTRIGRTVARTHLLPTCHGIDNLYQWASVYCLPRHVTHLREHFHYAFALIPIYITLRTLPSHAVDRFTRCRTHARHKHTRSRLARTFTFTHAHSFAAHPLTSLPRPHTGPRTCGIALLLPIHSTLTRVCSVAASFHLFYARCLALGRRFVTYPHFGSHGCGITHILPHYTNVAFIRTFPRLLASHGAHARLRLLPHGGIVCRTRFGTLRLSLRDRTPRIYVACTHRTFTSSLPAHALPSSTCVPHLCLHSPHSTRT